MKGQEVLARKYSRLSEEIAQMWPVQANYHLQLFMKSNDSHSFYIPVELNTDISHSSQGQWSGLLLHCADLGETHTKKRDEHCP